MKTAVLLLLVLALALPAAAGARADAAPAAAVGTWTRIVTTADTLRRGRVVTGVWRFELARTGSMRLFHSSSTKPVVTGRLTTGASGTLKMLDLLVTGGGRCGDEAIYRWRLASGRLTLSTAADKCPGRAAVLVGIWGRP